ncbi:MAG: heme ABC transporter ATP-binding protein [Cytophagales bacterium]|nr:heme ABC transporter ATP-binding protein [Cytophagales bacterium]
MLIAKNISYSIRNKSILRDVDLTLETGEFKAIVGPNGAGKSSLLKIITGENKSYKGKVHYHGKMLNAFKINEISKVRAVLPQESQVNFPFTVSEIVEMGRSTFRDKKSQLDKIVKAVMQNTNITHLRDRSYHSLSGGEKQKVQLTRVMAQMWGSSNLSRFIFLDEPTASLDMAQQHQMMGLAKKLSKNNIGVLAVIHDLNLAIQYADNIVFMRQGEVICQGKVKDIMRKENIETTFSHEVTVTFDQVNKVPYVIPKINRPEAKNNVVRNLNYESYEQINNY